MSMSVYKDNYNSQLLEFVWGVLLRVLIQTNMRKQKYVPFLYECDIKNTKCMTS